MKYIQSAALLIIFFAGACAQVPKESVELSATVGKDIVEIKKSHIALVDLYYNELISKVNEFIDNVYLPYQVQQTLSDNFWKTEMLSAIESASRPDATRSAQKEAFQKIEAFILIIQEEVESYRKIRLAPVKSQYAEVLKNINDSYDHVQYANSAVTGLLSSVVKVHETQNELLDKVDVKDLRAEAGKGFSGASDKVSDLIKKANQGSEKLDTIISKFDALFN